MAGIIYRHPRLYDITLRMLHGGEWTRRYRMLSEGIGKGKTVMDVGCGTCMLAGFLEPGCRYMGIEGNEGFVADAKKRELNVVRGDVFDASLYPDGIDVIVLSDILHHIVPRHDELISLCKAKADKVIVCEPCSKHGHDGQRLWGLRASADKAWQRMCANRHFNSLFGDDDGINEYGDMRLWDHYDKKTLIDHLRGLGMATSEPGDYVIGVWKRKD